MLLAAIIFSEVNDLHRFVSIALHTSAGEGDYESDKLATLRTVGTAFEPLIYGLSGDITYEIFCEKCRAVWDELEKNPKLPQMLVCRHIVLLCLLIRKNILA